MTYEHQCTRKIIFLKFSSIAIIVILCQLRIYPVSGIECGIVEESFKRQPTDSFRVTGGNDIQRGEWPFLVALYDVKKSKFFCGGTIISPKHVLTVAHCVYKKYSGIKLLPDNVVVVLGAHDLNSRIEEGVVQQDVNEIHIHPDWNVHTDRYDADIAILVLSDNVTFTNYIRPVCIPANGGIIDGFNIDLKGSTVGWGLNENKSHEDTPTHVFTDALNATFCLVRDQRLGLTSSFRTFCGGVRNGSRNRGDSGGGLFVYSGSAWALYGIVSSVQTMSNSHRRTNSLAVYTNVKMFRDWIIETVTRSGGAVGEAKTRVSLMCEYLFLGTDYACRINDLNIRNDNIEVSSVTGRHKKDKTQRDVVTFQFYNGTMFNVPDGIGKIFKNVKKIKVNSSLSVKEIRRSNFKNFKNLVEILFLGNEVEMIEEDILWDLPKLEFFQFSYNKVRVVSEKTFERNLKLRYISIFYNQLEFLPKNTFGNNLLLEKVSLNNNLLKMIDESIFANNSKLREVYLYSNQLEFLSRTLFANNLLLEKVSLFNNSLKMIDENIFKNNPNLREVYLYSNNVEFLSENIFENNLLLEIVSFTNNSLQVIEIDFTGFENIKNIFFYGNHCIDAYYEGTGDPIRYRNEIRNLTEFQKLIRVNCSSPNTEKNTVALQEPHGL